MRMPILVWGLVTVLAILVIEVRVEAQGSGIKGVILDIAGKPVPFSFIGVAKTSIGTMANEEGRFELPIPSGDYTVYFQCLGYQTVKKEVAVRIGFEDLSVTLTEQVIQTRDVTIASRDEDPAYSIMRKAITRAKINKLLVDSYSAEVYIRGSGRILKVPFLMRSLAKKNGLDENTVFFKETLEKIEFQQPNRYKERVVASRSTFGMADIGQNFLKSDLYNPRFLDAVSPLSPSAFRYYRFENLGAFTDRGQEVFKIKVIPKVNGEEVWKGEIYLIDKLWCLHSAHLERSHNGFDVGLSHSYAPVEGLWMPVQIKQEIKGTVLQISVEGKYNASIRNYKITRNEKLFADYQKLEQEIESKTDEAIRQNPTKQNLKPVEKLDKKVLRKLAKEYVKEKYGLRRKNKEDSPKEPVPQSVVSEHIFIEDSNATRKDSIFWLENRAVPLTELEVRSFRKLDSIRIKSEREDSIKAAKGEREVNLSFMGYLLGKDFPMGRKDSLGRRKSNLHFFSPLSSLAYNAVEGYALQATAWFRTALNQSRSRFRDDRSYIQFGPTLRYAFAREKILGSGVFQLGNPRWVFQASGGTEIRQINRENPISDGLSATYLLLDRRNLIRLYEGDFVKGSVLRRLTGRLEAEASLEWENRIGLTNATIKNWRGKILEYHPNRVDMPFADAVVSQRTVAFLSSFRLDWYPLLRSSLSNEQQYFHAGSSPRFRLKWMHAIPSVLGSDADFSRMEISYRQSLEVFKGTTLEIFSKAASMIRSERVGQMDALHLYGNQTFVLGQDRIEQFRNLPYYRYSTLNSTLEAHFHLYRKNILLGWFFPEKRKWGELVLWNGMANPGQSGFMEVGYGIEKIFRLLHVEVVHSRWTHDSKGEWRFRVGGTFQFSVRPSSYEKSQSGLTIML